MGLIGRNKLFIYFIVIYIIVYYLWLYFQKDGLIKIAGADVFSITASLISSITLFIVYKKVKNRDNYFWLFLSLGCFSHFIAVALESYYTIFLALSPDWIIFFYVLQLALFMTSFIYKLRYIADIKIVFDTWIIMTVAITFSWHYSISDLIAQSNFPTMDSLIPLGFTIGNLLLLFGSIRLYFGFEDNFPPRVLPFILGSYFIYVLADTSSTYIDLHQSQIFKNLLLPLPSVALLLMAVSGIYALNTMDHLSQKMRNHSISLRLLLPYIGVILLTMVMIFQEKEHQSLIFGSAIAILLVLLRQIFTSIENQNLLSKYHNLTEELELKIGERTEELSLKNQQLLTAVRNMKHMAYHDVLSGLPNRRMFLERLMTAMDEAKRNRYKIAIVFIDLDRFKNINDTLGHEFGDLLLKHVSKHMAKCVRKIDTISRQGGDEFTILLNRIRAEEDVIPMIERIRSIVAQPITILGQELHVSMSIGIAFYPGDGKNTEELMKNADMAMYRAKEEGRDNYKFFSMDMNKAISRKMALEYGLRNAIKNNEFVLYFQPQANIKTGEIVGVETLIRWNSIEAGLVPPNHFIPVAEETGLIIPIGEWVLSQACMQGKVWHDAGHSQLTIAVNLSPVQFLHENLVGMVIKALKTTGFNPNFLELEITEGVAFTDAEAAMKKMQALRDLGVRISIDDFGTGYSSLIYLKRFPINTLKIPKPFIQDINKHQKDKAFVETMIYLAHSLELTVVAEGIETREQLHYLKELRCDVAQGQLLSQPLTVTQLSALIDAKKSAKIPC
jgi:diguanylate cyclase